MGSEMKTDFLFAQPSFFSGFARLFDFWGLYDLYNVSPAIAEADARAIYADWRMVGEDIVLAMEQFGSTAGDPQQIRLFSETELRSGA